MEVTAAVAKKAHAKFELESLTLDEPRADEVIVKISAVGICHSDLAARDGAIPIELPAVLGHEGSGYVERVGESVTKVQPGDRVVLTFNSCGECPNCTDDRQAYCHQFAPLNYGGVRPDGSAVLSSGTETVRGNFFGQSSFADYALANERNVVKVSGEVPLELLGPLGCGIQTGAGAIMNSFQAPPGSSVLIVGAGAVGLSAVLGAVVQNCANILVSEPHASRRERALKLGATQVIDPVDGPLPDQVRAALPAGVDFVLDTSGNADVLASVALCLAPRGLLGLVGVPADPEATLWVNVIHAMVLGLRVMGIVEGDSNPDEFIPRLIELYQAGRFPFDKLVKTFPFAAVNDAIHEQETGETVKAVLLNENA
ncbi:NAD(P)-dependent alcohol dehydrogenase [Amycolatopsis acidiphila]|uniref:NAD(P)-dependent alcohol dehydrogenase n=1 Tax=Amycolatopsis acidiphila TaxID=715473 RepID=A0A557ZZV0_9PSEU|nr:NAD(P)-dependent alcohol dehydrogenase [Amycolatopsis acidiphila]TVT17545.1 NAD(P)-dependent alcohol dehydrogenase [Amycolatopsis acidiphila]UIJ57683.1 NAD(P)-dependent alcohol dehydrogenase [Amycolatopsis acidiphila]GHG95367.1 aryl-alcohol dehydrogenase [Amycolatopsis acidiphila]